MLKATVVSAPGTSNTVKVPAWTDSAADSSAGLPLEGRRANVAEHANEIGAYAPYLRTLTGDDATVSASLYHRVAAPTKGVAVSLELPQQPSVKILAVTVEE